MTFGERLAKLREGKGLTQIELANLTSISRSRLSLYETNKREPDLQTIRQLAAFFGVTVDELLGSDHGTSFAPPEIAKKKPQDLKRILEHHEIMFDGVPIDDDAKEDILHIVEFELYKRAKAMNKRKPKEGASSDK